MANRIRIMVRRGFMRKLIETDASKVRHGDVVCDKYGVPLRNHKRIPPTGYESRPSEDDVTSVAEDLARSAGFSENDLARHVAAIAVRETR